MPLTPEVIRVVANGRLLFFLLLLAGAALVPTASRRRWLPLAAMTAGALVALAALFYRGTPALWFRLGGDEQYVTAFYQRVISEGFGLDFSYPHLPPFYPPLYFYLIGSLAAPLALTGVAAAKLGGVVAIALAPLAVWLGRRAYRDDDPLLAQPSFWLLAVVLSFAVFDFPAILNKPYEFISAIGVLLWYAVLQQRLRDNGRLPFGQVVAFGAVGALLATTYYFWLLIAAVAVLVGCPWASRARWRYLAPWALVGAVTLALSAWYWWPLAASYAQYGMENWQPAFFVIADLEWFPRLEVATWSFWQYLGLFGLLYFRRRPLPRRCLELLAGAYLWQVASLLSVVVGDSPMQASRGFIYLGKIVLAFGAAYAVTHWIAAARSAAAGLGHVADVLRERFAGLPAALRLRTRWLLAWLGVCLSLPFGLWLDAAAVPAHLQEMRQADPTVAALLPYFRQHPEAAELTTLSFVPKLSAFTPLHLYVNHNQHFSHPAANFSRRLRYLERLASARTPAEFARRFQRENPFEPIEQIILYEEGGNYLLYFWLDDYPNGGREEVIRWPARLITEPYFAPVPELSVGGFRAWRPRAGIGN